MVAHVHMYLVLVEPVLAVKVVVAPRLTTEGAASVAVAFAGVTWMLTGLDVEGL